MTRIPLGRRTICGNEVNVPADAERFDFPREGKVEVEYDAKEHALIYSPVEDE